VLEEQQAAARPEDAAHLGERPLLVDATENQRRDDGVEARILERQILGGARRSWACGACPRALSWRRRSIAGSGSVTTSESTPS
jgi:hypothetical protein